jgi:hypothetical protein
MTGPSSVPPLYNPEELDPLSSNFNPDVFADGIIMEESIPGGKRSSKTRKVSNLISYGRMDLTKAVKFALSAEDPDSRGIYEDISPDMNLKNGRIDDEEEKDEEPPREDKLWDQDFDETQEFLRKVEAGEETLPDDDDDYLPKT